MKKYLKRTLKNKLLALALSALGCLHFSWSNDATVIVFISLIAVPLFFAKRNYVN